MGSPQYRKAIFAVLLDLVAVAPPGENKKTSLQTESTKIPYSKQRAQKNLTPNSLLFLFPNKSSPQRGEHKKKPTETAGFFNYGKAI